MLILINSNIIISCYMKKRYLNYLFIPILVFLVSCVREEASYVEDSSFADVCQSLPVPANKILPLNDASTEWFQVYESHKGVYSIVEPYQFQMSISHLILGDERALLFDTGMGMVPIKPVIESLTDLPVTVLNSHTHFDHVGGNAEFDNILAVDSHYTKANMKGFSHEEVAGDVIDEAFCNGPPKNLDTESYYTRAWSAENFVVDGQIIDLGNRLIEIIHVPGHTPDALALIDRENALLFTGDTYYDDNLWLFSPETDLDDYAESIQKLAFLEQDIEYIFGAHTSARVEAGVLKKVEQSFFKLRSGDINPVDQIEGRLIYQIDGINFVTSRAILNGVKIDTSKGASGL